MLYGLFTRNALRRLSVWPAGSAVNLTCRVAINSQRRTLASGRVSLEDHSTWVSSHLFNWDSESIIDGPLRALQDNSFRRTMIPQKRMKPDHYSFSSGFSKVSPRKLNLVTRTLVRMSVKDAMEQMQVSKKGVAFKIMALLHRSMANISHNYNGPGNETHKWFIKSMAVARGKIDKAVNIHARGRAGIRKTRHSTVQVILRYDPLRGDPKLLAESLANSEKHKLLQKAYNNQPMRRVLLKKLNQFKPAVSKRDQKLGSVRDPWNRHQFKYVMKPFWTRPVPKHV